MKDKHAMIPSSVMALFCEDIREEKSGALTLLGVMPDNVQVPPLAPNAPAGSVPAIPKLCIYVRLQFDPKKPLEPVASVLIHPDGSRNELSILDRPTIEKARTQALEQGTPTADKSGLSVPTIQRMEASDGVIRGNVDSLMKLIAALEAFGIVLIGEGMPSPSGGRGIRLKT